MIGNWLDVVSEQMEKLALLRARGTTLETGLKLKSGIRSIHAEYLKTVIGIRVFVRALVLCAGIAVPVASAFAQEQCAAYHHGHYGTFGEPVTDRGPLNRGPLIFDTPQAAVAAAAAWVTMLDGPVCGAARAWYLGAVVWQESTGTHYDMLGDVYPQGCSGVTKGVRLGHVDCAHAQNMVLQLEAPLETRPTQTGGSSSVTVVASTKANGVPRAGIALGFSVDVIANSGGHEHHSAARPKGTLSRTQGTTDANGEVKVTFKAPEVAGIHTIKATCATCSNSPATKEIQVKVPDLLPIPPSPPQNADGTFVYALTSVDQTHQGNGRYHHNQYYLTEQSQTNLQSMIKIFAKEGWGTVALNDASLYWGGRYDITSNWGAPHAGHREGREIDVSFARAGNPISTSKQKVFYKKFCETKTVQASFSILHHFVKNPHFHVYLEKQTACWKSEK